MGEFSSNKIDGFAIMTDFVRCVTKKGYIVQEEFEDFGEIQSLDNSLNFFG